MNADTNRRQIAAHAAARAAMIRIARSLAIGWDIDESDDPDRPMNVIEMVESIQLREAARIVAELLDPIDGDDAAALIRAVDAIDPA